MSQLLANRAFFIVITVLMFASAPYTLAQDNSSAKQESTYKVKPGETKYSLAKRFGMSIQELEQKNPHIKSGLQAGHILIINGNSATSNFYTVKKGDTKFSLAKRFGMTIKELEEANPQIVPMLKTGEYLTLSNSTSINGSNTNESSSVIAQTNTSEQINTNPKTDEVPNTKPDITNIDYVDLSRSIDKTKKPNVLFTLPFSEEEYQTYNKASSNNDLLNHNIEFYRGASIAIDSVKALGISLTTTIEKIDAENIAAVKKAEKFTEDFANYDAVIAPNYANEFKTIASTVNNTDTPIILAKDNVNSVRHEHIYIAKPSAQMLSEKMLDYISEQNSNTIAIIDPERIESKELIKAILPQASFIETSLSKPFEEKELLAELKTYTTNFVIVETNEKNTYLNVTNILLPQLSKYKINLIVLESALIPSYDEVSVMRYKLLKLTYPSALPLKKSTTTNAFSAKFEQQFNTIPTEYAQSGFTITYDTLLRIAQSNGFIASTKKDITSYLSSKIEYRRDKLGGNINDGIYIIQHHPDQGLIIVN